MLRVLIADDWAIFRYGIEHILAGKFGRIEVTHCALAPEALDLASGPWDLAVVSLDLPAGRGLQFLARLKNAYPDQRVLALALRANIPSAQSTLLGNILGLIDKESTPEELVAAVRKSIAGESGSPVPPGPALKVELSKRELQVLRLLAAGKGIKEVAATLNISAHSVSTYRVRMLRKLNLKSTAELIRYAFHAHLAD